jgi:putative membrane protein
MNASKLLLTAAVAAAAVVPTAAASAAITTSGTPSKADRDFMVADYRGGLFEIASARVVLDKSGTSAGARHLAHSLVHQHTQEVSELKRLAAAQHVTLQPRLTKYQQAEVSHLKTLNARGMSASFLKLEYDDHTSEIKEYGARRSGTKDAGMRAYVDRWIPVYRLHIALAEAGYRQLTGRTL